MRIETFLYIFEGQIILYLEVEESMKIFMIFAFLTSSIRFASRGAWCQIAVSDLRRLFPPPFFQDPNFLHFGLRARLGKSSLNIQST